MSKLQRGKAIEGRKGLAEYPCAGNTEWSAWRTLLFL